MKVFDKIIGEEIEVDDLPLFKRTQCKNGSYKHPFIQKYFPEQKDNPNGIHSSSRCPICGEQRAITNKGELAVCLNGEWELYDGYED